MKRVMVVSLGCAKNLVDTEVMLGQLVERGWAITAGPEAELYLINTCGFLEEALAETFAEVEELIELKRRNPNALLAVVGCGVEAAHAEILERFPEADLVVGTGSLSHLGELIDQLEERGTSAEPLEEFLPPGGAYDGNPDPLPLRVAATVPHVSYLKLAEGCDLGCTFCAIPALRGPQRSRPVEDIVDEAIALVGDGVRELILIAQETTAYGRDLYGEPSLPRLLRELSLNLPEDDLWLRILYPNPFRVDRELLELMAGLPQVVPYLDLPFQHVDDGVLKGMGRIGSADSLIEKIALARELMPDLTLRGTALVGFPGEDPAAFDRLVAFVEETAFDHLGVFAFSPRPGTAAFDLPNQVDADTGSLRAEAVYQLQEAISQSNHDELVGENDLVLVDDVEGDTAIARSYRFCPDADGHITVELPADHDWQPGDFREIVYTEAHPYTLTAKPADGE